MLTEQKRFPNVRPVVSATGTRYSAYFQFRGIKYEQQGFDSPEEASLFASKWKAELTARLKEQESANQQKTPGVKSKSENRKRNYLRPDGWHKMWGGDLYVKLQNNQVIGAQLRDDTVITNVLICSVYTDGRFFKALPVSYVTLRNDLKKGKFVVTDMQREKIEIAIPTASGTD